MDESKFHLMMNILNSTSDKPITPLYLTYLLSDNPIKLNCLSKVAIKNSEIQGKGVFATKDINKGQVITFYPCHGMSGQDNKCLTLNKEIICSETELIESGSYTTNTPNGIKIYGSPNIIQYHSLGHMINDCAEEETIENLKNLKNSDSNIKIANANLKYLLNAKTYRNCSIIHHKNYCYIIADKDITSGTELRTYYDATYWLSPNKINNNVYFAKLNAWLREKVNKKKKTKYMKLMRSVVNLH